MTNLLKNIPKTNRARDISLSILYSESQTAIFNFFKKFDIVNTICDQNDLASRI